MWKANAPTPSSTSTAKGSSSASRRPCRSGSSDRLATGESPLRPLYWLGSIREEWLVLTIRLARFGKKKHPFYRVIVTEKTRPRNGRFVEIVGTYDPSKKPAAVSLKSER